MTKKQQQLLVDNPALKTPDPDTIWSDAYAQFNADFGAQQEERAEALQDRRFVTISGAQWEGQWEGLFTNSIMIEINKAAQGTNDILAQYKANRYTVDFRSVNQSEKDDAAETLNGMYRADLYHSKGTQARDNAFTEGLQGGYGAWRLTNVYCNDEDEDDTKQKIVWETIVDADQNVFWDTNSRLYDKSDAAYCFVISPLSEEAFKDRFGDDKIVAWPEKIVKPFYDWFQPKIVKVAEYYRIIEIKDRVYVYTNPVSKDVVKLYKSDDDLRKDTADLKVRGYELTYSKDIKRKECRKWILSGAECLSEPEGMLIAGGMIPVIPYYGMRSFIDNQERCRGHVRLAKDPQRVYNVQVSKLVETAALAPIERPIFFPEQMTGHEQSWAEANINRAPYALINPIIDPATQQIIPTGAIGKVEPPQLSPVLGTLLQLTNSDIKELTNSDDGAAQVKANVSADAMNIAATRTDDKAALYLDNMQQSVQREGEIYLAMSEDIYFETDREVPIIQYSSTQKVMHKTAMLNKRVTDPETGNQVIKNQLAKNQFNVISDVTEQTATRRDKTVKSLTNASQLIQATNPELSNVMMSIAVMNMDGEGIVDLQTWIRNDLVTKGVLQPTEEEAQAIQEQQAQKANEPPPPQDQLALAAAEQQKADAAYKEAQAKTEETKALLNEANANKIRAETEGTHVDNLVKLHAPLDAHKVKPEQKQPPATQSSSSGSFLKRLNPFAKR